MIQQIKNSINRLKLGIGVLLHNKGYVLITNSAVKLNNGIHPKHRIMNYHQFFEDNIPKDSKVLDIGCGNGLLACDLAKKAKKVVAVDLNEKNIETAAKRFAVKNIEYIHADATTYHFKEKFDYIILSNVLEHIENRIEFLKQIKNIAPVILIRVPMISRGWLPVYLKEKGYEYRLDSTHHIEYTLESFQKEIKNSGLKIKKFSIQFGEIWAVVNA